MAQSDFEEIAEDMTFLDEWEDRYRYIIDLGKAMPPLTESQRVPATKVNGCASQVWIVPQVMGDGASARISFDGDSDAIIVRGLIAVLRALFNGHTAAEVMGIDAPTELARLGLDQHLSAQRSNGLRAMIERVRAIAAKTSEAA
ncbi:MAG: SufE family protein [Pseudomonadota bacterium]